MVKEMGIIGCSLLLLVTPFLLYAAIDIGTVLLFLGSTALFLFYYWTFQEINEKYTKYTVLYIFSYLSTGVLIYTAYIYGIFNTLFRIIDAALLAEDLSIIFESIETPVIYLAAAYILYVLCGYCMYILNKELSRAAKDRLFYFSGLLSLIGRILIPLGVGVIISWLSEATLAIAIARTDEKVLLGY